MCNALLVLFILVIAPFFDYLLTTLRKIETSIVLSGRVRDFSSALA